MAGRLYLCFFFQAEDGIRYWSVTGVQTCALPICRAAWVAVGLPDREHARDPDPHPRDVSPDPDLVRDGRGGGEPQRSFGDRLGPGIFQIGRASCRERV